MAGWAAIASVPSSPPISNFVSSAPATYMPSRPASRCIESITGGFQRQTRVGRWLSGSIEGLATEAKLARREMLDVSGRLSPTPLISFDPGLGGSKAKAKMNYPDEERAQAVCDRMNGRHGFEHIEHRVIKLPNGNWAVIRKVHWRLAWRKAGAVFLGKLRRLRLGARHLDHEPAAKTSLDPDSCKGELLLVSTGHRLKPENPGVDLRPCLCPTCNSVLALDVQGRRCSGRCGLSARRDLGA